jgi:hypothetical protein
VKNLVLAIAILVVGAAISAPAPAYAQNYPWCAYYSGGMGGGTNCGFTTFAQCQADVSGIGGFCARNSQYEGPAPLRRHKYYRQQ